MALVAARYSPLHYATLAAELYLLSPSLVGACPWPRPPIQLLNQRNR
jgi:hypothetical protein